MSNKQMLAQQINDDKSLDAAISAILEKHKLDDDNCLPAIIISYDRKTNLATVRPLIQIVLVNKVAKSRNPLTKIHVLSLGAGGFHINFPVKPGDLGWIVAADRDLSRFRETLSEAPPNNARAHTFSDGLFVPDVMRKYTIAAEDADAMVIQSVDSATRISIRGDNIKVTAPSNVTFDTPKAVFNGDVEVKKNLKVTGTSTLIGKTSVEGLDVKGHNHANPEGGDVGPMKN